MKTIKNIVFRGSFYAVLIAAALCFFAMADGRYDASLSIGQFFLIVLFGVIGSAAQQIFLCDAMPRVHRYLIHYAVLLLSFFILSIATGKIAFSFLDMLIGFVAFSAVYLLLMWVIVMVRRCIRAEREKSARRSGK